MRRTGSQLVVKDNFRKCGFYSHPDLTLCEECREKLRKTYAIALAIKPCSSECLVCDICLAVNETMAVAEEIEVHCNFTDSREGGKRRYDLVPPELPK